MQKKNWINVQKKKVCSCSINHAKASCIQHGRAPCQMSRENAVKAVAYIDDEFVKVPSCGVSLGGAW